MSARRLGLASYVLAAALVGCGDSSDEPAGDGGLLADGAVNPFFNSGDRTPRTFPDGSLPQVVPDGGLDEACGANPFDATQVPANLLLVIDKSGSMADTPNGFDADKWSAMKSALETALTSVQDDVALGIDTYPFPDGCDVPTGDEVQVPVEDGRTALPKILDTLSDMTPSGNTPTAEALARARRYFTNGEGADLPGDPYVLLATDGGPNCNAGQSCAKNACTVNLDDRCPMVVDNCCDPAEAGPGAEIGCLDDTDTVNQVERLAAAGIPTFVVGIPGSEAYADALDAFAEAGGRPNADGPTSYFAVSASGTGAGGLTDVLRSITRTLITSCRFQLESDPPDVARLNVEIDGKVVPMQGADGWILDEDTSPPSVVVQGATCERVEQDGAQSVVITFGCPTKLQ